MLRLRCYYQSAADENTRHLNQFIQRHNTPRPQYQKMRAIKNLWVILCPPQLSCLLLIFAEQDLAFSKLFLNVCNRQKMSSWDMHSAEHWEPVKMEFSKREASLSRSWRIISCWAHRSSMCPSKSVRSDMSCCTAFSFSSPTLYSRQKNKVEVWS